MPSLRHRITALLLAVAFLTGLVHCTLDMGCESTAAAPAACAICWCHVPAIAETAPVQVKPVASIAERTVEAFEPNARIAAASIFNPPKA
jgi:hypothetical protein